MKTLKKSGLSKEEMIQAYREVLRGRRLDERLWQLTRIGKTSFNISGQGAEVAQVAMAMAFDPKKDYFLPYYRDMTACLVWGMTSKDVLLGSFGKEADPSSHGRQMPNHYGSKEHNIVSFSSTVSTQMPLATGVAYSAQLEKSDFVTLTTTGEGSANQGEVQEAMNFAGVKKLPVIFVVENNDYAISVPIKEQYANEKMSDRAHGYGFEGITVDGNDFTEVYLTFKKAVEDARSGKGPKLIELMVSRLTSHSADDDQNVYRSKEEIEEMKKHDPLDTFEKQLIDEGYLSKEEIEKMDEEVRAEVDKATDEAEAMPDPLASSLLEQVYAK
ncbi:branched-chain alpha-keto acid dehydrogenase, E1 component, alpha subunit [Enterococcus phoeniculicola]|jgi:2-oxoisovalerate dehydrogenase E1 component alpha subunit|uniref:2-oxoisovalerate dehydrogenase subunit alpha n=1 Tax=Enterococcus phoeniculicola ATCC BAA-412 TaxID=1158610 RepID=R3WLH6_9ENTE|nr:thiamine pyrophosphate-dependent dehydrogenase E1 component subunit alpha [Enterococcus phoeniculicola]EOL42730.1 branched-chain alpha-keto acid dehydrogenase, E1 component, alpha subunit [Enterococcus phoeniculicola ATCC BAA-412]EOT78986.1 branched-chain alpha-keto acid dehydrogenase, E1 component, alpha subunit [Enterococcus phoeniculicola ATCC BAA-412]OJG72471.1 branched-chain alpha-keto acid dehydrogenase, E1 component, alpha subunit [Enterococcus phoeniculicola]